MEQPQYFQDFMPGNVCFGCGRDNHFGLQISSYWEGEEAAAGGARTRVVCGSGVLGGRVRLRAPVFRDQHGAGGGRTLTANRTPA